MCGPVVQCARELSVLRSRIAWMQASLLVSVEAGITGKHLEAVPNEPRVAYVV